VRLVPDRTEVYDMPDRVRIYGKDG